jgi:hypothetical protein
MAKKKLVGAAAMTAALAGGGALGMLIGTPVVSGAQTDDPSTTTTAPEDSTTTTTPDTTAPETAPDPADCEGGRGRHGFGHRGRLVDLAVAADALGVTEDELRTELEGGSSIADVATEKGVDLQTVIAALVADATADIDEKLAAGDIDQERADALKANLSERITDLVERDGLRGGPNGEGGFGHRGRLVDLAVAADALGVTEDELRTELEGGSSIADIATEKGVDLQTVIAALVADATADIDEKLAAGDIDQERADALKADLSERITDLVERDGLRSGRPGRGPR